MDCFLYNNGLRHERVNNKMNRLHENELRTVYSDFKANFGELLGKYDSFNMHYRDIQTLPIEMFKFLNGLSRQ